MHIRWRRILEWPHQRDDIGGRRGLEPRIEPVLDARKGGFRILRINLAAQPYGARPSRASSRCFSAIRTVRTLCTWGYLSLAREVIKNLGSGKVASVLDHVEL